MRVQQGCVVGFVGAVVSGLLGCSSIDEVQSAYGGVRAAMTARSAYVSVKDVQDAAPVFKGYSGVVVLTDLQPRSEGPEINSAFSESVRYQIEQAAKVLDASIASCEAASSCSAPVLTVQFRESAFNRNLVEKVTMGKKLRGTLSFVDQSSGPVISEFPIEGVATYIDVLGLIKGKLLYGMLKSFPDEKRDMDATMQALNELPAAAPGREDVLASS